MGKVLAEIKTDMEAGFQEPGSETLYGRFPDLPHAKDSDFQAAKGIWQPSPVEQAS